MEEEFDDDEEYIVPQYKAEVGAFERVGDAFVGIGTKMDIKDLAGKKVNEMSQLLGKLSITPQQKLQIYIEVLSIKYNAEGIMKLSSNTILDITSYISRLEKPEYINPIGFILGYLATNGGKNMIKSQVKKTIALVKKINDGGITEPDVVRYSRLWMNISK